MTPPNSGTLVPSCPSISWSSVSRRRGLWLGMLVVQTTFTVLLLRHSRTQSPTTQMPKRYLATTAVFLVEVLKYLITLTVFFAQNGFSIVETWRNWRREVVANPRETGKLFLPAALYTLQNNLLYIALTNLDAATYQVTYQLKILTTSLFSVLILSKKLRVIQWIALVILTIGVALVQMPKATVVTVKENLDVKAELEAALGTSKQLIGLVSVLIACLSSGFAGVYFEKLVKTGSQPSVIIRNLQLGIFSLVLAMYAVIFYDLNAILSDGFFQGYTIIVGTVVFSQAIGGLVVAVVIKLFDNIQKGFATSISIILSSFCSFIFLNDLSPGLNFILGTILVIGATFLYGSSSASQTTKQNDVESQLVKIM